MMLFFPVSTTTNGTIIVIVNVIVVTVIMALSFCFIVINSLFKTIIIMMPTWYSQILNITVIIIGVSIFPTKTVGIPGDTLVKILDFLLQVMYSLGEGFINYKNNFLTLGNAM